MRKISALCNQTMLEAVFSTIPLVWEIREHGNVIASVYARLEIEGDKVLTRNQPLVVTGNGDGDHEFGVRLVDQGGALYIDFGLHQGGRAGGSTTFEFPPVVFTLTSE